MLPQPALSLVSMASTLTSGESIWPTLRMPGIFRPMKGCDSCELNPMVSHACAGEGCNSIISIEAHAENVRRISLIWRTPFGQGELRLLILALVRIVGRAVAEPAG